MKLRSPRDTGHAPRALAIALTVVLSAFAAAQVVAVFNGALRRGDVGYDAWFYLDEIVKRWLATGEMYYPVQFVGPYPDVGIVNLYPPLTMYLFVPMSLLPRVLWWAVPLATLAWHVWTARPTWWSWPLIALASCTLPVAAAIVYGNTDLWCVAFVALACRFAPAALLLALKPSMFPIALLFARDRRWWFGLAMLTAASIPFGALWIEWFVALGNVQSNVLRNAHSLPLMAIPALAWWTRAQTAE